MRYPRLVVVAVALLATSLVVRAQQAPPAQAAGPRPLVPMAASSLLRDPASHMGENVSLMALVDAVLSKTAFTLDQDRAKTSAGQDLLVLAPTLTAAPDLNMYLTVQGEVMRFDPAEIAKKNKSYTIDLPPDVAAKYMGRPMILATAVVNPLLVDLAKKALPPLTAAELAFQKAMLSINPTFTALRGGLATPDAAQAKEQVAILKTSFTTVEGFFKTKGMAEPAGWAGDAIKLVTTMEQGVTGAKWDDVKTAAGTLQGLCAQCHGVYRERQDDGSFRIKG